jgi:hypothetical protein
MATTSSTSNLGVHFMVAAPSKRKGLPTSSTNERIMAPNTFRDACLFLDGNNRAARDMANAWPWVWSTNAERTFSLAKLSQVNELMANIYSTHNAMCHREA